MSISASPAGQRCWQERPCQRRGIARRSEAGGGECGCESRARAARLVVRECTAAEGSTSLLDAVTESQRVNSGSTVRFAHTGSWLNGSSVVRSFTCRRSSPALLSALGSSLVRLIEPHSLGTPRSTAHHSAPPARHSTARSTPHHPPLSPQPRLPPDTHTSAGCAVWSRTSTPSTFLSPSIDSGAVSRWQ